MAMNVTNCLMMSQCPLLSLLVAHQPSLLEAQEFGQYFAADVLQRLWSWILVEILKMKFDQDLCLNLWYDPIGYFGKMNSALGSVVPLAMFLLKQLRYLISVDSSQSLEAASSSCINKLWVNPPWLIFLELLAQFSLRFLFPKLIPAKKSWRVDN